MDEDLARMLSDLEIAHDARLRDLIEAITAEVARRLSVRRRVG
jgi:hypothetical protein